MFVLGIYGGPFNGGYLTLLTALFLAMFVGALLGARFARGLGNLWIRRIYFAAVWLLGLKTLLFDVFGSGIGAMRRPDTS